MEELHVDSIRKSYKDVILSDIFLSCQKGEINGLIGRNGSGKSTLLKIIFGVEKAETKFVKVGERIINGVSDTKGLLSYLPQNNFLPNNVKISSIIKLFLPKQSHNALLKNDVIKQLLNKVNQDLSYGERRVLEILLIVNSTSKFVLLDEPFNGLSPLLRDYIVQYILEIKSQKGFIITDHDYINVIKLADNLNFLDQGYLRKIEHKNELMDLGYLPTNALHVYNNNS